MHNTVSHARVNGVKFFVGLDRPFDARNIPRAFISAHALKRRKNQK